MSRFRFSFQRAYRLRPARDADEDHVSEVIIAGDRASRIVLLPYSPRLGYFVAPTAGTVRSIVSDDFHAERLSFPLSLWVRLRLGLIFKTKKLLRFEEFSLFSYGAKPERKRFTTFNQHVFNIGVPIDGALAARHPELLEGWPAAESAGRSPLARGDSVAAAVAVYIYYEDTWTDIAEALKRLTIPFDLIVTTVPWRDRPIETIRGDFPDAEIRVVENRGRDIRPFLELLESGRLDRYRYVCKIHGKKSILGGRLPYYGALWRRRCLFDLLAGPGIGRKIVDEFERYPKVGMIGPRVFRLPGATVSLEGAWGESRAQALELAAKMGVAPERFRLDYYGGTMFWVRPEALKPLRDLRLARCFVDAGARVDGGLEHVVERLFSTAAVVAGYELADSDGRQVSHG
jgi:hypothetical protein